MNRQSTTLYKAISPEQLTELKLSKYKALSLDFLGQQNIYLKFNKTYAEMIARQWHLPLFGAAFIVGVKLPNNYLNQFIIESFGLDEHRQYRVPAVELINVNRQLSEKIRVISGLVQHRTGAAKTNVPLLNMTELRHSA
ncbi:MAG: hypothetical protein ACI90U_001900 [Pseudomonadales bacterium]|jgi:hypothetical protein